MEFRAWAELGFVSGQDFSRAVKEPKENGLSP
jgi:hypothetical protein